MSMKKGILDVITGPMFSGKSEELIQRLERFRIASKKVQIFHYYLDKRYGNNTIASHSKMTWKSTPIDSPLKILKLLKNNTHIVVIDESQFFDKTIIEIVNKLLSKNIHVIVAGLDTDFRGEPFGSMPSLLALADGEVIKLKAICAICKKWTASRTQRILKNGVPAPHSDKLVKIGAQDSYQARCRVHHEVPK